MKKTLSLLLALLMLLPLIASCGAETKPGADTAAANDAGNVQTAAADTEPTETDRSQYKDSLPDNLDFDGYKLRFLHRNKMEELAIEVIAPETSGDIVNDAIYERGLSIEERLNVSLTSIPASDDIHSGAAIVSLVRKSVLAGSDEYDAAFNHMSQNTPLAGEGLLLNVLDLDYLDFDQPWWAPNFMEQATLFDKCYFLVGDASLTLIQSMYLIYYNKELYGNFFTDNLYDTVFDGGWTLDKLSEIGHTVYTDVNGDGATDVGDIYGYSTTAIRLIDALLVGADIQITARDSDNVPYFVVEDSERTYTFIEKIAALLADKTLTWRVQDSADGETDMLVSFSEGTRLFIPFTPMGASQLRSMKDDFGVLPMPKLNEAQAEYTTSAHNGFSSIILPITCGNPAATAAALEAMGAESYRTVIPAYYETALKVKYSRDDETSRVLDGIRDSVKFDFAYIYNASLNTPMTQFRSLVQSDAEKAASTLASNMNNCNAKLEILLTTYKGLQ